MRREDKLVRHPSGRRSASPAPSGPGAGIFTIDAPAAVLFKNFGDVCRRATVAFYHRALGGAVQPQHLVPTDVLNDDRGKKLQSFESLRRYFQDLLHPMRPIFPHRFATLFSNDPGEIAVRIMELRTKILESLPAALAAARQWGEAEDRLNPQWSAPKFLRSAGQSINAKELGFTKADDLEPRAVSTSSGTRSARPNACWPTRWKRHQSGCLWHLGSNVCKTNPLRDARAGR